MISLYILKKEQGTDHIIFQKYTLGLSKKSSKGVELLAPNSSRSLDRR